MLIVNMHCWTIKWKTKTIYAGNLHSPLWIPYCLLVRFPLPLRLPLSWSLFLSLFLFLCFYDPFGLDVLKFVRESKGDVKCNKITIMLRKEFNVTIIKIPTENMMAVRIESRWELLLAFSHCLNFVLFFFFLIFILVICYNVAFGSFTHSCSASN